MAAMEAYRDIIEGAQSRLVSGSGETTVAGPADIDQKSITPFVKTG